MRCAFQAPPHRLFAAESASSAKVLGQVLVWVDGAKNEGVNLLTPLVQDPCRPMARKGDKHEKTRALSRLQSRERSKPTRWRSGLFLGSKYLFFFYPCAEGNRCVHRSKSYTEQYSPKSERLFLTAVYTRIFLLSTDLLRSWRWLMYLHDYLCTRCKYYSAGYFW